MHANWQIKVVDKQKHASIILCMFECDYCVLLLLLSALSLLLAFDAKVFCIYWMSFNLLDIVKCNFSNTEFSRQTFAAPALVSYLCCGPDLSIFMP